MGRTPTTIIAAALVLAAWLTPAPSRAIDKCKAKIGGGSSLLEVTAKNVVGTPQWGVTPTAIEAQFADLSSCLKQGTMRRCEVAGAGLGGRGLVGACTVYVKDDASTCAAFLRGCSPHPRDRGPDGVHQINQARALAGGVSPGDLPGFPVTLSERGSYRLTSDLDLTGELPDVPAILVDADDVTIDLNGYQIVGGLTGCPDCTPSPPGGGIGRTTGPIERTVVLNGTVRNLAGDGLDLGRGSIVGGVHVESTAGTGLHIENGGLVEGCTATRNASHGISAALVRDSVAHENGGNGVVLGGASARGLVSTFNQGSGVHAISAIIRDSVIAANSADGVHEGRALNIIAGNTITGNTGHGVESVSSGQMLVVGNHIRNNGGFGLEAMSPSLPPGYGRNVIKDNTSGTVTGAGAALEIDPNLCDTNTTCP